MRNDASEAASPPTAGDKVNLEGEQHSCCKFVTKVGGEGVWQVFSSSILVLGGWLGILPVYFEYDA